MPLNIERYLRIGGREGAQNLTFLLCFMPIYPNLYTCVMFCYMPLVNLTLKGEA